VSGSTKAAMAAAMKKTEPSRFSPLIRQARRSRHGGLPSAITASPLATRKQTEPR
jgi:hypothetical protein